MNKYLFFLILGLCYQGIQAQAVQDFGKVYPDTIFSFKNLEFGRSVAIDGNYAVVGEPGYNGSEGRAYVFFYDGSGWSPIAKLTASDAAKDDRFGISVGISGDIIVVGADGDDVVGLNSGSSYVFEKPTTGWVDATESYKLTPSDGAPNDGFGFSVSTFNAVIVVGAYGDDDNGNSSGSAYIFEKPASNWSQSAKLKPSDGVSFANFGYSVSISGQVIAIGAYGDDDNGSSSGSVYIFEKPITGWTNMAQTAKLIASDGAVNDALGRSVCISGDVVAAGASGKSNFMGAVYVFEKPITGWANGTQTAKLTASDAANYDYLGFSVCISGNVVVAGAYRDDNYRGSAYVFTKPVSGWADNTETAKLTASNGVANDRFGEAVTISGDIILSGAVNNYTPGVNSGSVYAYHKPISGWTSMTEDFMMTGESAIETDNNFGLCVSMDGNYAVIGQAGANESKGQAFVYEFNGTQWNRVAKLTASDGTNYDFFGFSLNISGDVIVIGAYGDDDNGSNSGSAYVFVKPASGWADMTQTAKLTASDGAIDDFFGYSVSNSGDIIAVGAYGDDDNGSASGSVYIFEKPASGWADMTQTAKLNAADGAANDNFGYTVSISGDVVVSGAYLDDNSAINAGSAYVFEKPVTGWTNMTQTAKLTASDGAIDDNFGY